MGDFIFHWLIVLGVIVLLFGGWKFGHFLGR
jgi:hypothetical protein